MRASRSRSSVSRANRIRNGFFAFMEVDHDHERSRRRTKQVAGGWTPWADLQALFEFWRNAGTPRREVPRPRLRLLRRLAEHSTDPLIRKPTPIPLCTL